MVAELLSVVLLLKEYTEKSVLICLQHTLKLAKSLQMNKRFGYF